MPCLIRELRHVQKRGIPLGPNGASAEIYLVFGLSSRSISKYLCLAKTKSARTIGDFTHRP